MAAAKPSWPVLKNGSSGKNVYALQCLLNYRGANIAVDGSFGTGTKTAVSNYQRNNGISPVDGEAGTNTLSRLIVNVQRGNNNAAAKAAQYLLSKFESLSIDGDFGIGSDTATRNFQSKMIGRSDGIIGPESWQYLFGYNSYPSGTGGGSGSSTNWLNLKTSRSQTGGRTVLMPSGITRSNWASFEGSPYGTAINPYAPAATVKKGTKGELLDGNGRHWVAVGPKVMNPNHANNKAVTAAEMKYTTKIDVSLTKGGSTYYLYAVVGDCKAHTYPTGIVQTGNAFPNGTDPHPQNADGSVIEFMGAVLSDGMSDYSIDRIYVYD